MQQLKADAQRAGLVGVAVILRGTVGVHNNILANLCHAGFHRAGHRDGDGALGVGGFDRFHRLRRRFQRADDRHAALVQLLWGGVDKLIAGVGGGAEGFGLALEQVQSRENGRLGAAAGHKIDMLESALGIQLLFNFGDDLFDFHIRLSLSSGFMSSFYFFCFLSLLIISIIAHSRRTQSTAEG